MNSSAPSLEDLIRDSKHALVIGVGGARPAQAVRQTFTLDQANDALHAIGIRTELDHEREFHQAALIT